MGIALRRKPAFANNVAVVGNFTTTFATNGNPISEGGKWANGLADGIDWTDCQVITNILSATSAEVTTPPFNDSIAHLKTSFRTFTPNQFAQGTVHRTAGYTTGHEIELLLRFSITSHSASGYEVYWSTNGGINIVRWNGLINDFVTKTTASPGLANDGDIVRAEIVGSNITVKINGSVVLTDTDTTWTTGQPGVGNNPFGVGFTFFDYGWSSFTAGNL